ncbi:membrane protein YIP1 [Trypanosoma grayi]|uniref:membrane protein YIP1 n=1 Tax=Trypanosoma grayi TaxID=71804 RepID=UPI0004F42633|nr:membrane protein YIP1 [Trypanosoma grayi]KEG11483.1 membrane protein YIP1 [Trypanosoma grayi]
MLNILFPKDAFNNGAPQESVPIYQRRFGYPEDDLPLLEELGIFPHQIRCKAWAVLNPFKAMAQEAVEDMDLAGPIVFAVTLAFLLSLQGKIQFSTIYGHSVLGIIFMKVLLSLMTDRCVPLQFVISALGYGLIPSIVLAACHSLVYWLIGYVGKTMLPPALLIVLWSALCATAMLVNGLSMEQQRYLILYPIFLFYAVFAALTIF